MKQVTHLVIRRPQFFQFKPGDYIYINIPVIAKYEWHPFTISSAPEQTGVNQIYGSDRRACYAPRL